MTRNRVASLPTPLKRRSIGGGGAFAAGDRGATESAHPTKTTASRPTTRLIFLVVIRALPSRHGDREHRTLTGRQSARWQNRTKVSRHLFLPKPEVSPCVAHLTA